MKALSMWQPWASFVAAGIKTVETRSWSTEHRGPLLICSAKRKRWGELHELIADHPGFGAAARRLGRHLRLIHPDCDDFGLASQLFDRLPYGQALAVVDVVAVEYINRVQKWNAQHPLGDFTPGRYVWRLRLRQVLPYRPVIGRQGLFEVDLEGAPDGD